MSIIADALERLQARSSGTTLGEPEAQPSTPTFNQGEGPGRHRKDSGLKFSMIAMVMAFGLGGLALSSYWIGWQLDFGFSPNTHARMANNQPVPPPPLGSEVLDHTATSSGTVTSSNLGVTEFPSEPTRLENREDSSHVHPAPQGTSTIQDPSPSLTSTKAPPGISLPGPQTPRELPDQKVTIASVDSVDRDSELIALKVSSPEEPEGMVAESDPFPIATNPSHTKVIIEENAIEAEESQPFAAPLARAVVVNKENIKIATAPKTFTDSTANLTDLSESPESESLKKTSRQFSSTNQLLHAQQLIRLGEYKDAVTLLSPLFREPPVNWQPWFWMGTALLGQGEIEQADQFLLSGLARNDKIPQLWIQRAIVAQQRGDYQLAIHELRQAESLEANLPHIHLNMGYAYERLSNDRLANQYYGKFLKLSEGQPAFFPTRKKLFARLTQQSLAETLASPSPIPTPQP